MDIQKQPDESNQAHYERLLRHKQELEPVLREAKRQASVDANVREADRRHKRDVAKAKASQND